MKTFDGCTYYEVLKVPLDADMGDIKTAYREALEIYGEEALATYSLFTDDQRAGLLKAIENAYRTLIDPVRRKAYDQSLVEQGRAEATAFSGEAPEQAAREETAGNTRRNLASWVKKRHEEAAIRQLADEITGKEMVSGSDLKRLRKALDIQLVEIFDQTRISQTMLTAMEEDKKDQLPAEIFLRSFLKSYADILQIDAQRVVDGYLKHLATIQPTS